MSGAPGVVVNSVDSQSSSNPPVSTGTAFIAGLAERGPVDRAVLIRNLEQFRRIFGERVSYGYLWDAVEIALAEGASSIWVSRAVGPTPVQATANVSDGASGTAVVAKAKDPGSWGNSVKVTFTIPDTGQLRAQVEYPVGTVVETSPIVTSKAALIAWSSESEYIRLTDGGGGNVAAGNVTLSTGTDDRANITITEKSAALLRFLVGYGPGQIAYPGDTTDATLAALAARAAADNRVFIGDVADTKTVATLLATASALRALTSAPGGLFAGWARVAGVTAGTTRTIPWSIVQLGLIARLDRETGNPNEPAAGANGISRTVLSLTQSPFTKAERETLNEGGVNVVCEIDGTFRTYGYRTPADPFNKPLQVNLNNARLEMAIKSGARVVGERFNFRQIDGKGHMLSDLAGALAGEVMLPLYDAGAIFGDSAPEAFTVDTSDAVNPIEQLQDRDVVANIKYKPSPFAERVTIQITKEDLS